MKKTKESTVEIFNGAVYTSTYLQYDSESKIVNISNEKITGENVLEIDNELIKDFQTGKKQFSNYKIEYFFNLKNGIVQKEETVLYTVPFLNVLPLVDHFKNEITLLHNKSSWELKIRDDLKYDNFKLLFYLTKKDDPSYFYSQLAFDLNNLKLEFKNSFEYDLKKFSVAVMKKFNSYGVKENYEI